MNSQQKKIRIKDIARMANVSEGTVDRVIHGRGEVSEKSREKVEAVLKQIDYHPNVYASALASKKTYTFLTLIPEAAEGEYWYDIKKGIDRAARELLDLNITITQLFFDQYDIRTYRNYRDIIPDMRPDGMLLAPVFKEESLQITQLLDQESIPYVFIDSDICGTNALSYFGVDSFQSGYLAAKLLLNGEQPDTEIAVFQVYRSGAAGSNQTELRQNGFKAYSDRFFPDARIHQITIYPYHTSENEQIICDFLTAHPQTRVGVTFNSKAFLISGFLEKEKPGCIKLLGYDLLSDNVSALKCGYIDYLIAQRPEVQSYRGIKALCEHKVFKHEIKPRNLMPIDILTAENIDYYLNFRIL